MPLVLERRLVVPGVGRYLPRVCAFNENHDEAGRFAESAGEGGGGGTAKPTESHVQQFHAAKQAYQSAKDNFRAVRQGAFNTAKEAARTAVAKADEHAQKLTDAANQISANFGSADKPNASFAKAYDALDGHQSGFEEAATLAEKSNHFARADKLATKALDKLIAVIPVEGNSDRMSAAEFKENRTKLREVIAAAKAGREAIRTAAGHVRDAKAIRDGGDQIKAELGDETDLLPEAID